MNTKNIMTMRQVADLLHCSEDMVRKQARLGVIPSFRIGSLWRFEEEKVLAWIDGELGKGMPAKKGAR